MLDVFAIERVNNRLGFLGGLMDGAIPKVDDLFRVAERPAGIGCVTLVTRVGGGTGVAVQDGIGKSGVIDGAGESAVALAMILAVPSESRQPDFKFDVRIAGGLYHAFDAAEIGQLLERWGAERRCG